MTDDFRYAIFEQVESFHASLVDEYTALGYGLVTVPKTLVEERAAFVQSALGLSTSRAGHGQWLRVRPWIEWPVTHRAKAPGREFL